MRNMNIKIIEDKQNKKSGKNNVFSITFIRSLFFEDSLWRFFSSVEECKGGLFNLQKMAHCSTLI